MSAVGRRELPRRLAAAAALLAAVGTAPGCGSEPSSAAHAAGGGLRPHIVLVVCDALRADHLELHGYGRATAPSLAAWAREGLVFERATAPSNWTRPSMDALFTGREPPPGRTYAPDEKLSAGEPVLPEILRAAGYETIGLSANLFMSPRHGADRGFDRFVEMGWAGHERTGHWKHDIASPAVLERLEVLLDEREADLAVRDDVAGGPPTGPSAGHASPDAAPPVFLYLHFMDPHLPYDPPEEHRDFCAPGYGGPIDGSAAPYRALRGERVDESLPPGDRAQAIALYDGEIRRFDEGFARLRGMLAARLGEGRPIVTVLTSDHGEAFGEGERGAYLHGIGLGPELLDVPLVVRADAAGGVAMEAVLGVEAGRVAERVGLVDLLPTLIGVAGAGAARETAVGRNLGGRDLGGRDIPGRDLLGVARVRGREREPPRAYIAHRALPWHGEGPAPPAYGELAVLRGPLRAERRFEAGADGRTAVSWRLVEHTGGRDLTAERPADLAELRAVAERWIEQAAAADPRSAEQADLPLGADSTLEALGYTGR